MTVKTPQRDCVPGQPTSPAAPRPDRWRRHRGWAAALLAGGLAGSVALAGTGGETTWAERAARFGGIEWVTRPSQDAVLTFGGPVEIRAILATGGTRIKRGQPIVQGRDDEQRAARDVQAARASNDTEVRTAEANLELAQSRFDAAERAKEKEALNPAEYDERRIGLKAAKINLESAQQKLKEEQLRLKQLDAQIERFRLDAPFDGVVQEVIAEVGQTMSERAPVIRVIATDPMFIDVPVPTSQTMELSMREGKPAWLLLDVPTPAGGEPVLLTGTVLYVSPAADSASGTRRVRVSASNPQGLPPGTRAAVRFSQPPEGWAERAVSAAQEPQGSQPATTQPSISQPRAAGEGGAR